MQGARPIYIYRLAPCTENCSQRIYKTFSIKYLEHVHIFSTFEPKKHKSVFQAAVSTCTLKILCCGYNLATQKRRKFIRNYDTRRYKEYSFSSLSANKGVNQQVMRFTPFITPKNQAVKKKVTPKTNSLGSSSLLREVYKFEKRKDFTFGTILTNHFGKRNFLRHFG